MLTLRYFARFRERLQSEEEHLTSTAQTVRELMDELARRGDVWADIFGTATGVRVAVNQEMVSFAAVIQDGDDIAFFPPVTGG